MTRTPEQRRRALLSAIVSAGDAGIEYDGPDRQQPDSRVVDDLLADGLIVISARDGVRWMVATAAGIAFLTASDD